MQRKIEQQKSIVYTIFELREKKRKRERYVQRKRKHEKKVEIVVDELAQGELECINIYGHCNISRMKQIQQQKTQT